MQTGKSVIRAVFAIIAASFLMGDAHALIRGGVSVPPPAFQYLAQQFSTPLEIWSTELQNSSYAGAAIRVRRTDNDVETDIPFSGGKYASVSAFNSACSGTTCLLAKVYGQMGLTDCVQATKANMQSVLVGTDGKLTIQGAASKWCASTNVGLKAAIVHAFGVFYPGYVADTTGNSYAMWSYGAASISAARYGLGLEPFNTLAEYISLNGAFSTCQFNQAPSYGNAHLGGTTGYHVWDNLSSTVTLRHDAVDIGCSTTSTNISYPATQTFYIGNDGSNTDPFLGKWRALALYSSARADRDSISNFLVNDYAVTKLPTTTFDSDGFPYTPQYFPSFDAPVNIFNISQQQHTGGYPWSLWIGNVANATTLNRYEVHPFDQNFFDTNERAETSGVLNGTVISPGSDLEMFAQILIEPGPVQSSAAGGWCDNFQFHYGDGEQLGAPDMLFMSMLDEQFQWVTGRDTTSNAAGTPMSYTRGVWYAMRISTHISSNHTSDTLQIWMGPNGGTLTQIANIGSSGIYNTNVWNAYLKQGIYRGFPGTYNNSFAVRIANYQVSTTLGAYSSFVTSQPALPTH